MIRNIFFDLDDTLFDFKRAESEAIRETFIKLGIEHSDESISLYSKINRSCWEMLERRELTRAEVLTKRFELLFSTLGIEGDPDKTQKIYERELSLRGYYIDGAEELLHELSREYDIYLATNGIITVQEPRIASTGISKYVKNIFISERLGFDKPDKRFFERAFSQIEGFRHDESIIIGDSLSSDILGGYNAGIKTVYFNPKGKSTEGSVRPDYEIRSLADIKKILGEL